MLVIINCGITGTVMREGIHIKDITFSLYCGRVVLGTEKLCWWRYNRLYGYVEKDSFSGRTF